MSYLISYRGRARVCAGRSPSIHLGDWFDSIAHVASLREWLVLHSPRMTRTEPWTAGERLSDEIAIIYSIIEIENDWWQE